MARIKTSAIISDIRGKIGGSVFQGSKGGLLLKNTPFKSSKKSNAKSLVIVTSQAIHGAWRNLTSFQKSIWGSFANYSKVVQKNDKSLTLNANELFFKLNFQRFLYGHDILITPEFSKCQFLNFTGTLRLAGPNLFFDTSRVMNSASEFIILKITPPLLPSVNSASSRLRNIVFATADADVFNIKNQYLDVFKRFPVSGNALIFSYTNANLLTGLLNSFVTQRVVL